MCNFCPQLIPTDCVSIVPARICMKLLRDTDATFEFVLTNGRGEPVDITLDEVRLTVREYIGGSIKIEKANPGGTHIDGPNGRTRFSFVPGDITDTQGSDTFYWVYEVRRIQPSGDEAVHITGEFLVEPAIEGA